MVSGMRQPCVLVVDPNPATLKRVQAALDGAAYPVLSARDAVEAEGRAGDNSIAVVLSSTGLPRGNGYDLARTLLAHHPQAKVFLMSGGFEVYNRDRAEQAGVTGRISKPFSPDGLRARLEAVLGPLPAGTDNGTSPHVAAGMSPAEGLASPLPSEELYREDTPPPGLEGELMEPLIPTDELLAAPPDDGELGAAGYTAPTSAERVATILPRDYSEVEAVAASTEALEPAVERAVMEVLPEVVETVLRRTLQTSAAFRDLVEVAVDEAVRAHLHGIARRLIAERLSQLEALDDPEA